MPSRADLATRLSLLLDAPIARVAAVGGGTFGRPYRVTTAIGREYFVKEAAASGDGMLRYEASGLGWLADAEADGGVRTARVVAAEPDLLVLDWVAAGTATRGAARRFGAALAATHAVGAAGFGAPWPDQPGYIASEVLPEQAPCAEWPDFYAEQRLRPFLERATTEQTIEDDDRAAVQAVIDRIDELAGPAEPPARVHGDLWSGNVLWSEAGAVLIDPSAHGGHRESDLAMLSLFGLPYLEDVFTGYQAASPLADGWQQRVGLHQIYPLLVHAVLFGDHYGRAAGAAARAALDHHPVD